MQELKYEKKVIIVILFIVGIFTLNKLNLIFNESNSKKELKESNSNSNQINNQEVKKEELKMNLKGTFQKKPLEDDCIYFTYTFYDDGTMKYISDVENDGIYVIEENKVKITYTIGYDPTNGLPRDDLIRNEEELTIIDENILVSIDEIYFYLIEK